MAIINLQLFTNENRELSWTDNCKLEITINYY